MKMKAELLLSRPKYPVGNPVVGTVRIHYIDDIPVNDSSQSQKAREPPIRQAIVSARLFLAGRAHLGSSARDKSSRWRSTQEVNQLKSIYGEHHPCLSVAIAEENSRWSEWNGGLENESEDGPSDDVEDAETFGNKVNSPRSTSFNQRIEPPQVTHIEQAERLAVHSCLHHSASTSVEQSDDSTRGNQSQSNDFSHLPAPHENNVICVWMTNVLELLNLPERHLDRNCVCAKEKGCQCQLRPGRGQFNGDMYTYRPLQLPDLNVVNDIWKEIKNKIPEKNLHEPISSSLDRSARMSSENVNSRTEEEVRATLRSQSAWRRIVDSANPQPDLSTPTAASTIAPLEEHQLAFSFRANLPPDVPPTMSTECVKYFYSAVLLVTTVQGKFLVSHCPFMVLTSDSRHYSNQQESRPASTTRVHIGNICAIAHSTALPTYITSTEASNASSSQLKIIANPPACSILSRLTAEERTSTHRIEDGNGGLCAMMTLIGFGGPLTPGTRLGIRIRFPCSHEDDTGDGAGVIPCHRVCCALVGEEYVVHEVSGGDNLQKGRIRVKTRNYVFDSAYEVIEFGYTEAVSMGLVLPLDCPVTVKTDLVEVTMVFKVEFTVSRITTLSIDDGVDVNNQGEYQVIRLDLPCEVVHDNEMSSNYFGDGNSEEEMQGMSLKMQTNWKPCNERHADGVDDIDIQSELNILSIRMLGSYLHREVK